MTDLLSGALPPVSLDDMIRELEREKGQRARVYPRLIDKGKLGNAQAAEQMRRLDATINYLRARKYEGEP